MSRRRELDRQRATARAVSERFSSSGRCCSARTARTTPPVLLIDELDRADEEFEGYLLELLVGLPGHDSRARHDPRRPTRRSSSSRPTGRARCTTRSSGAASTSGLTTRSSKRSCGSSRKGPGGAARLAAQVTAFVQELRAARSTRRPACRRRSTGPRRWLRSTGRRLDAAIVDDTLGILLEAPRRCDRREGPASRGACGPCPGKRVTRPEGRAYTIPKGGPTRDGCRPDLQVGE